MSIELSVQKYYHHCNDPHSTHYCPSVKIHWEWVHIPQRLEEIRWMHACMVGWTDGCIDGWMNAWMVGLIDGWMDGSPQVSRQQLWVMNSRYFELSGNLPDDKNGTILVHRPKFMREKNNSLWIKIATVTHDKVTLYNNLTYYTVAPVLPIRWHTEKNPGKKKTKKSKAKGRQPSCACV